MILIGAEKYMSLWKKAPYQKWSIGGGGGGVVSFTQG